MKGNERLTYKNLPKEFSKSELGMASFKLAKKNRTISFVYRYLSLASAFAAIGFINRNRYLAYGFIEGQFVVTMLGVRHGQLYNQRLDRTLWLYNKDVLFPTGQQ